MAPRPTLTRERAVWAEEQLLVGVDEAGRGPLAGPVVAAAVVFPPAAAPCADSATARSSPPVRRAAGAADPRRARSASASAPPPRDEIDRLQHPGRHRAWRMRRAICRLAARRSAPGRSRRYRILIDGLPLARDRLRARGAGGRRRPLPVDRRRGHPGQDGARSPDAPPGARATRGTAGTPTSATAPRSTRTASRLHGPTRHHRLTFAPLAQLTLFA